MDVTTHLCSAGQLTGPRATAPHKKRGSSGTLKWWGYLGEELESKWELITGALMENKPQIPMVLHSCTPVCFLCMLPRLKCFRNKLQSVSRASFISLTSLIIAPCLPFMQYVGYSIFLLSLLSTCCSLYLNYSSPSAPPHPRFHFWVTFAVRVSDLT